MLLFLLSQKEAEIWGKSASPELQCWGQRVCASHAHTELDYCYLALYCGDSLHLQGLPHVLGGNRSISEYGTVNKSTSMGLF